MKATAAAAADADTGGQPSTSGNDGLSNVMYIGYDAIARRTPSLTRHVVGGIINHAVAQAHPPRFL